MNTRGHGRLPAQWLERAAAASLGFAVAFAIFEITPWPVTGAFAAAVFGGLGIHTAALKILKAVAAPRPLRKINEEPAPAPALGAGELFVRLQDVLAEASAAERSGGELLLDDRLDLPPDSRVVRLFHGVAMPTAGELHARIDRHLGQAAGAEVPKTDDSGDLFNALASLKRSLG